jgi:hypothetical protein
MSTTFFTTMLTFRRDQVSLLLFLLQMSLLTSVGSLIRIDIAPIFSSDCSTALVFILVELV